MKSNTHGLKSRSYEQGELAVYVAMFLLVLYSVYRATGFTPTGRLFPMVILAILGLLLILKIICYFSTNLSKLIDVRGELIVAADQAQSIDESQQSQCLKIAEHKEEPLVDSKEKSTKEFKMIGFVISLLALIYLIGFTYGVPIFLFIFLKIQGKLTWLKTLIYTSGASLFVYLMFVLLLRVRFPVGILF